jgi:hypothetical protein
MAFGEGFSWGCALENGICSTPITIRIALTKFLSILHSKFEMPSIRKIVSLKKMHNFCIG